METLKYALKQRTLHNITNDSTYKQYRRHIDRFATWAKETHQIRLASDVDNPGSLVQEYANHLRAIGYTPDTIHSYLAPVTKGFGFAMNIIVKPKRISSFISKTRDPNANMQGQRELSNPKYLRAVQAEKVIGIRRQELAVLTGDSLTTDYAGNTCVLVRSGKGGKRQLQRILPQDVPFVQSMFAGIGPRQKVFSPNELKNKIPLHALRRAHAQEAYEYYLGQVRNGKRDALIDDLKQYYLNYHVKQPGNAGERRLAKQYARFCADLQKGGGRYRLRGPNLSRAEKAGRPTEYDRIALMCVSVFHLAHWRNDVTVRNYMI